MTIILLNSIKDLLDFVLTFSLNELRWNNYVMNLLCIAIYLIPIIYLFFKAVCFFETRPVHMPMKNMKPTNVKRTIRK